MTAGLRDEEEVAAHGTARGSQHASRLLRWTAEGPGLAICRYERAKATLNPSLHTQRPPSWFWFLGEYPKGGWCTALMFSPREAFECGHRPNPSGVATGEWPARPQRLVWLVWRI